MAPPSPHTGKRGKAAHGAAKPGGAGRPALADCAALLPAAFFLVLLALLAHRSFRSAFAPGPASPWHASDVLDALLSVQNSSSSNATWEDQNPSPPSAEGGGEEAASDDSTVASSGAAMAPTAVCLVGGARSFEATGPSLVRRMLPGYAPADLFVHAPLDQDAAKLWALGAAPSIAAVRVFENLEMDQTLYPSHILRSYGSPNAVQGLLQYFRLVEGCVPLIEGQEQRRGSQYTWIVRARLDSYWAASPPGLESMRQAAYTIPYGSDNEGYNDRFGVGLRRNSLVAMQRLSRLDLFKGKIWARNLNSELAYKAQFDTAAVPVARAHFPFCVLTHRPPVPRKGHCEPPMTSIQSSTVLDGSKCMPCAPCEGPIQNWYLNRVYESMSLPVVGGQRVGAEGLVFCNFTGAWQDGLWQPRFDSVAGSELAEARENITSAGLDHCVARFEEMKEKAQHWDAPDPRVLCSRQILGSPANVGNGTGAFSTFLAPLSPSSVVLAVNGSGGRGDHSWEHDLEGRVPGISMLAWDPTASPSPHLPGQRIDILKLSAEGHDFGVLNELLASAGQQASPAPPLAICQLLVALPSRGSGAKGTAQKSARPDPTQPRSIDRFVLILKTFGFQLDSCIGAQRGAMYRCHFFSPTQCTQ